MLVAAALLFALAASACAGKGEEEPLTLTVEAVAGPVCPVQTDPPKPECADRPVAGAVIVIFDDAGEEVARFPTGDDGSFSLDLLPGAYLVEPQPVEGLMGTAFAEHISLIDRPITLTLKYDTGIR
jgi:hypothetical protein